MELGSKSELKGERILHLEKRYDLYPVNVVSEI
jgi:hypothetical protein